MNYLIRGARVVGPRAVTESDLLIEDGRIAKIGLVRASKGAEVIDAKGLLALPGFIDLHVHGGMGFDLTGGMYDAKRGRFDSSEAAYSRGFPTVAKHFARHGVTRALLATSAAPMDRLENALEYLADYMAGPANGRQGARLEGAFLEGTYILKPERAGAQDPAHFFAPDAKLFDRLNRRGTIRYVNVVPEFGRRTEVFLRHLARRGVLAGAGHCECPADQALRCEKLGLRTAVHFLNGAVGTSFKPFHGGNMVEAVLRSPTMIAELICDGWHINSAYVLDVIARKGLDRIALVTDAVLVAGLRGAREFQMGSKTGAVDPTGQYVQLKGTRDTLAGSLLTMDRAFSNALSWLTADSVGIWQTKHRAMPLDRALTGLARACAATPAQLLGLDRQTGSLTAGRRADVVLASLAGRAGRWDLQVRRTFVDGCPVT